MKKIVGYALAFYVGALLVSWGVGLLRQALPVLIPLGIAVLIGVVIAKIRQYNRNNRY